jgi:hypothetical protein
MNKARFVTGNALNGLEVQVGLDFHKVIDYDRKAMRAALVRGAGSVRKEARSLLARRAVSKPGEAPGRQTGKLWRSIGVVSRGTKGGWIKVGPKSIPSSIFYPAFLFYGVKTDARIQALAPGEGRGTSNRRGRGVRAALESARKASGSYRLQPRMNYMEEALKKKAPAVREEAREALRRALVPR